ncbi:MAG: response regulator [Elusimicrobia bacterium]|nr:response regulator [Elusimicrobiota bacterium]
MGSETRKARVMVVDDDPDCLAVVSAALKGCEVLALSDPDGLAGRAEAFAPDVLILDIQLKETDGFALCRDIKGRRATHAVPVVFLSGLISDEAFQSAFGAGGAVYVTKPIDPAELRRTVADLLRGRGTPESG